MQACLEMLTLEVESQPEALELVERIQRAQDHLHHLYEEVRSYAAPITIVRQACDMARLVREVWHQLQASWQRNNLEMKLDCGDFDTTWHVDRFAMGQVIRNVLENAIAASPAAGLIEVDLSTEHVQEEPRFLLSIRDSGPGIERTDLPQVFNAFFTTKTKGTGLGMPISKRIVEAHGGQMSVFNHAAGGAVFRISLS
jgi:signal transduction histidine kinase